MTIQKIILQYEPKPENLLRAVKELAKNDLLFSLDDSRQVSRYFSVPLARVYSLASFFDLIPVKAEKKMIIKVCSGAPCAAEGSFEIIRQIESLLRVKLDEDSHPKIKLVLASCQGLCDRGPVVMIGEQIFERVSPEMVDDLILNYL